MRFRVNNNLVQIMVRDRIKVILCAGIKTGRSLIGIGSY